jgi:trk system potassium uptake protein TrkH
MGVLVFVIAILPKKDKSATQLAKAEMPGPQFGKLVSKIQHSALILYAIYIVLTLIEFGVLCALDMPVFDSINHAMTTASTGGFSIKNT